MAIISNPFSQPAIDGQPLEQDSIFGSTPPPVEELPRAPQTPEVQPQQKAIAPAVADEASDIVLDGENHVTHDDGQLATETWNRKLAQYRALSDKEFSLVNRAGQLTRNYQDTFLQTLENAYEGKFDVNVQHKELQRIEGQFNAEHAVEEGYYWDHVKGARSQQIGLLKALAVNGPFAPSKDAQITSKPEVDEALKEYQTFIDKITDTQADKAYMAKLSEEDKNVLNFVKAFNEEKIRTHNPEIAQVRKLEERHTEALVSTLKAEGEFRDRFVQVVGDPKNTIGGFNRAAFETQMQPATRVYNESMTQIVKDVEDIRVDMKKLNMMDSWYDMKYAKGEKADILQTAEKNGKTVVTGLDLPADANVMIKANDKGTFDLTVRHQNWLYAEQGDKGLFAAQHLTGLTKAQIERLEMRAEKGASVTFTAEGKRAQNVAFTLNVQTAEGMDLRSDNKITLVTTDIDSGEMDAKSPRFSVQFDKYRTKDDLDAAADAKIAADKAEARKQYERSKANDELLKARKSDLHASRSGHDDDDRHYAGGRFGSSEGRGRFAFTGADHNNIRHGGTSGDRSHGRGGRS